MGKKKKCKGGDNHPRWEVTKTGLIRILVFSFLLCVALFPVAVQAGAYRGISPSKHSGMTRHISPRYAVASRPACRGI